MVASIGVVASSSQGVSYYQRDGYYAKDDPAHLEASVWAGKGAEALGLSGPVDPDTFEAILGQVATVESVGKDGFGFRLEDGSPMKLGEGGPQIRHLDRAWAATIHAFQGRTVDRIIAAMPSGNTNLVNQKSLYVAISRARDRADLVTDDPKRLADQLERATGERIAALDAVAEQSALEAGKQGELTLETHDERSWEAGDGLDRGQEAEGIEVGEARTGHETGMMSPDRDEERTLESAGSGQLVRNLAASEAKTVGRSPNPNRKRRRNRYSSRSIWTSASRASSPLPAESMAGCAAKIIPNSNPNAFGPSHCMNRTRGAITVSELSEASLAASRPLTVLLQSPPFSVAKSVQFSVTLDTAPRGRCEFRQKTRNRPSRGNDCDHRWDSKHEEEMAIHRGRVDPGSGCLLFRGTGEEN